MVMENVKLLNSLAVYAGLGKSTKRYSGNCIDELDTKDILVVSTSA